MYILLKTAEVWRIEGAEVPDTLFQNLGLLLMESDIIVIGSYGLDKGLMNLINSLDRPEGTSCRPYFETFDLNRDEYPEGRAWEVFASERNLKTLADLTYSDCGKRRGEIGFDHILAYRDGSPLVPLLNYHDSFNGGYMLLTGLYSEKIVTDFCNKILSDYMLVINPELND